MKNRESIISRGHYSQQSNFYLKKAILYTLKNPLNFVILPATHKQGNVTLMFYMKLLVNYCFHTRHAIIMLSRSSPTLGKFSLDHFSIRRSRWPQVLLHQCKLEWIFNDLDSIFPSLAGFWIPMAGFWIPKVENSHIPGFPYMGWDSAWKQDMHLGEDMGRYLREGKKLMGQ